MVRKRKAAIAKSGVKKKGQPTQEAAGSASTKRATSPIRISFTLCFVLLLVPRLLAAYFSHVADCDETFNYWEPVHFMVFGFGQQTWEYSPVYALRTYAYLLPHALFARIGMIFASLAGVVGGGGWGVGGRTELVPTARHPSASSCPH